jgi:hypothetical protein
MNRRAALLLVLLILLTACQAAGSAPAARPSPVYVLSSVNSGDLRHNTLTLIESSSWKVQRSVPLPPSWAQQISRDPQGRLWLGFSGTQNALDNRVQVYSPQGELLRDLQACADPGGGISFAAGRAFITCSERGFSGKVAVVNLDTLALETTLALSVPNAPLLLIASAADDSAVVVAGLTTGVEESSYSVIILIDPHTLAVRAQFPPRKNTDIWRIIPHQGRFYLLNVGSWRQPRDQANDVLVLDPSGPPSLSPLALAASPLWGAIEGDALYTYHNPTWNQPHSDPQRLLSRMDLRSGQVQTWMLPANWDASDLTVLDGQILLAHWEGRRGAADGLYRFDLASGQLQQLLKIADAARVLEPL